MPRVKAGTSQRGYGYGHQQQRAAYLRALREDDGQPCSRCHQPMWWTNRARLDLDHDEARTGYRGLAHRGCNRRAGQAKAIANRTRKQPSSSPTTRSRNW